MLVYILVLKFFDCHHRTLVPIEKFLLKKNFSLFLQTYVCWKNVLNGVELTYNFGMGNCQNLTNISQLNIEIVKIFKRNPWILKKQLFVAFPIILSIKRERIRNLIFNDRRWSAAENDTTILTLKVTFRWFGSPRSDPGGQVLVPTYCMKCPL